MKKLLFTLNLLHESSATDQGCCPCRRPAHLSPSGAGRPLLRWDQVPEIWWGPPSVDHRHRGERQPHGPHYRQAADHRGGAAGSNAECQPDSRRDLVILRACSVTPKDREKLKPLAPSDFRHKLQNHPSVLTCIHNKIVCTEETGLADIYRKMASKGNRRGSTSSPSGLTKQKATIQKN